jgi:hypothetical protein
VGVDWDCIIQKLEAMRTKDCSEECVCVCDLPSVNTFIPRPVLFAGRCTTSILPINPGTSLLASHIASRLLTLKASEPQKSISNGSLAWRAVTLYLRHAGAASERTEAGSCQNRDIRRRRVSAV